MILGFRGDYMSLNNYRDEVKEFLIKMGSNNGDNVQKVNWLNEEFDLLKEAVNKNIKPITFLNFIKKSTPFLIN